MAGFHPVAQLSRNLRGEFRDSHGEGGPQLDQLPSRRAHNLRLAQPQRDQGLVRRLPVPPHRPGGAPTLVPLRKTPHSRRRRQFESRKGEFPELSSRVWRARGVRGAPSKW